MTPKLPLPSQGVSTRRRTFLRFSLTCFSGLAGATASFGQEAGDEAVYELEELQVLGIQESLSLGIDLKRESYQMIDAIVAEDIGKFPDNNVVEALQRVPGVQTTGRERGEVSTVTIRGFNDVTTTVNGRNIFTASGRSVALADIPAALLYRVDVFKTRSASQIEHGIAGVIDIKTQRPFYLNEERTVIAARGIYSELASTFDPNLSALYTNTWETDNGRFGVLVNVSYARTRWTDKSITSGAMVPFITANPPTGFDPAWGPLERIFPDEATNPDRGLRITEDPAWQPGLESGLPFGEGSTLPMTPVAGGPTQDVPFYLARDAVFSADFYGKRERPAANVSLQWAPNRNATYTVEAFYNGYREDWNNNLMFSLADWWGTLRTDDPSSTFELIPGTNIIKSRTLGNPFSFMSGDKTDQKTDSYVYAIAGEWKIGDNLDITADLSHQTSRFKNQFLAVQTNRIPYSLMVDFNEHDGVPAFSFGDNPETAIDEGDLTLAEHWNIGPFFDNRDRDEGDATEFTLDGDYRPDAWGFIESLGFGVRYDMRGASESQYRSPVTDLNQPLANFPEMQHINTGYYDGQADIPQSAMVVDADYLLREQNTVRQLWGYPEPMLEELFEIDEKTYSGYVQANFRQEFGRQALSGQVGARYVKVERDLTFYEQGTGDVSTADTSGDDILPSVVVLYDVTEDVRLRASYGETLRYPGFGTLNPNINLVPDVTNIGYGTASGGNPNLRPTESKNYDLSLEYYFADSSLVYATVFKRKIDGLVVDFVRRITAPHPTTGEPYDFVLSAPDNASNGEMDGWEFGLVWFPGNLPEWLDGVGVQASYTILDSVQDIPITNSAGEVVGTETTPFFNVSDSSYSVVLAYEKPKYSVRLSYVWREDFLNNYEQRQFANPLGIRFTPQSSLDLQFTYQVTDNWTITFDATNLTEEEFHSYYADPSQAHNFRETHNFGNWLISRTFAVGTRFSF